MTDDLCRLERLTLSIRHRHFIDTATEQAP